MVITAVLHLDTYRVQNLNADGSGRMNTTFHPSQLKIWRGRKDFEESDECENESISSSDNHEIANESKSDESSEVANDNLVLEKDQRNN